MSGWKTRETQRLPQFWYMGKGVWGYRSMNVMVTYSHETRKAAPALVFIEEFWLNKGFCFRIWGFMSVGWEIYVRLTKLPQFLCMEEKLDEQGYCFKRGSGNGKDWLKRIGWKGLPQLVCFSFACFWLDDKEFSSSWDIIIFSHFFIEFFHSLNFNDCIVSHVTLS